MAGTTTRLSLPFPQLTDPADISQAVPPLTTLLDTILFAQAKGLLSARPAASATQAGRFYYATDNGIGYFCDGAAWQRLDLDLLNRVITLEASKTVQAGFYGVNASQITLGTSLAKVIIPGGYQQWYDVADDLADTTNTRFNIKRAGTYRFRVKMGQPGSGAGFLQLVKNTVSGSPVASWAINSTFTATVHEAIVSAAVNDFFEIWAINSVGVAANPLSNAEIALPGYISGTNLNLITYECEWVGS